MTQSELTTRYPSRSNNRNVISIEARKRCVILRRLAFIQELKELGLDAEEIKTMVADDSQPDCT